MHGNQRLSGPCQTGNGRKVIMDKNQLRKELKSLRNRLSKEEVAAKSSSICRKILATAAYRDAGTVFAYLAFGNEVNIDGVISQALTDGKTVCVPVVTGPHSMQAVKLNSLNCIKEGAYGIRIPQGELQAVNPSGIGLVLFCRSAQMRLKQVLLTIFCCAVK